MPMLGAILTPHPPVLLPEVGKGREREIAATSRAMAQAAAEVARWAPDVLIVASPHTILYGDYFPHLPRPQRGGLYVRLRRAPGAYRGALRCPAAG